MWCPGTHAVDLLTGQVQARQVHELQVHIVSGVTVVGHHMDAHPPATGIHKVSGQGMAPSTHTTFA